MELLKSLEFIPKSEAFSKLKRFIEAQLSPESRRNTQIILIGATIVIISINSFVKWNRKKNYFKKLGVPGPTPLPVFGNFLNVISKGVHKSDKELMEKYGKICGCYEGSTPVLFTTDTRFIKAVLIKDFNNFINRRVFETMATGPLSKNLVVLKDEEWKNVRSIITTSFTSGKLRAMSRSIIQCGDNFINHIDKLAKTDDYFNSKNLFGCFTIDVITCCCFGVDTNSISDPNHELIKHLQALFSNSISTSPIIIISFLFPKFARFLSNWNLVDFFPKDSCAYLQQVTNEIIRRRKAKLERRDDFIQNILEHEESSTSEIEANDLKDEYRNDETRLKWKALKKTLNSTEILSQIVLFLIAGYETTALTLGFIAHNLAYNRDIQEKLCSEIDRVLKENGDEINYDSVNQMQYLEMVISETLRMYPPGVRTDRITGGEYEYNGIKMDKGLIWNVPIYALHHDPDYYPEPEKFIPERFSEDGKKDRDNEAFLPFGGGPRGCVGMRFAMLEMKIIMSKILSKYQFVTCDKSEETVVIDNSGLTRPLKPIILKLKNRF